MRTLTVLLATLLAIPALAADHELSFELGSLGNTDPAYDLIDDRDTMRSLGGRAMFAFHDRFAVVAGYQRVRRGARLQLYDAETEEDGGGLQIAMLADEFTLGAHADLELGRFLQPYIHAQGLLFRGQIRVDDDPNDSASPGQVKETKLAAGFLPTAGLELHIPQSSAPFTLGMYTEMGWAFMGRLDYETFGEMEPGGLVVRVGAGVRL